MNRTTIVLLLVAACALLGCAAGAQSLTLPPGRQETVAIAEDASYLADGVKIQDCPKDEDNPLGLCNNLLFGGMAMFVSHLQGSVQISFSEPVGNVTHFEVRHAGIHGADAVMRAPQWYQFNVTGNTIGDSDVISAGDLNLATGAVENLNYEVRASNAFLDAFVKLNPNASFVKTINFTGFRNAQFVKFAQRPDGLLDFTFYGSAFVALGNKIGGDAVRIPLPFCRAEEGCRSIEAPGTSLHPRLRISTVAPDATSCGDACPAIPVNSLKQFTLTTYYSSLGDHFKVIIPDMLGGEGFGRAHLQGRLYVQFGDRYGDTVPVAMQAMVPTGLLAKPPASPLVGYGVNAVGHNEILRFPKATYYPKNVALSNDQFDYSLGVIDLRTGQLLGDFIYRGFPTQNLFFTIFDLNAGRIPQDSFRFRGPAVFEPGVGGALVFRWAGLEYKNFTGFLFPNPNSNSVSDAGVSEPGSELEPFLNFQATEDRPMSAVKSGQITATSSFGDPITIRYSVACDGSSPDFTLEYTNGASDSRGGTFQMNSLAGVSCSNPYPSTAAPGEPDIVSFSGFGTWSKDSDLHFASGQFSTASASTYWSVQVDGGLLSNANNKPPAQPVP